MTPGVQAWIVNYRSSAALANLLDDLDEVPEVTSVVVLDNASPDDERDAARLSVLAHSKVRMEFSEVNLGFGDGHNMIATMAADDPEQYVWLLNPDLRIGTDIAARMPSATHGSRFSILSPVILTNRGSSERIWFSGGTIDLDKGVVHDSQVGRDPRALGTAATHLATEFITGAAPFMSRARWDRIGGFDERLFLYWEDVDLSLRAGRLGIPLTVVGDAAIMHLEGASSRGSTKGRARAYYYMARNRIWVSRACGARVARLAFASGLVSLLRLLAFTVRRDGPGRVRRVLAVLAGTFVGFRTPYDRPRPDAGTRRQEAGKAELQQNDETGSSC